MFVLSTIVNYYSKLFCMYVIDICDNIQDRKFATSVGFYPLFSILLLKAQVFGILLITVRSIVKKKIIIGHVVSLLETNDCSEVPDNSSSVCNYAH